VIRDMENTVEQWNVELDAPARVSLVQTADKAKLVNPWRQYLVAGFLGLIGFGLAIFGVTFLEFHSRRLNSAVDVAHGLGITVMGDLPALRRRASSAKARQAIHGLVAESINSIRATLVRNADPDGCNTYLVTSAGDGEWKTTVASQLAASLARSGRRTLLIDGDLRHPGAHLVFGVPNDYGLCELLRGEIDVADAILPTPADGLWMIPAGRCCAVSLMALGKDIAGQVFAQLESRFEFIVIDTGPVLSVADPLVLRQHVDGAILSVLRDVSKIHRVYEANERLKLAGVKVVGAVINGVDDHGDSDRYNLPVGASQA
jgi:capsular exopolysaccharide synthesis family protein